MSSLLAVAIDRAGIKGARACEVVVAWAIAEYELGHRLGALEGGHLSAAIREYGRYWKQSERTVWRELGRFKAVFPEEESPARLAALLGELQDSRPARSSLADLQLAV